MPCFVVKKGFKSDKILGKKSFFYIWSTFIFGELSFYEVLYNVHYRTHDLSLFLKSFHPMKYFKQGDVILSNIYN